MVAIFSDVILMSNYHGWWRDIIHKTVKSSHLQKLQIMQNINKLILRKTSQFYLSISSWGKQIFKKFYLEFWLSTGEWIRMHKFNAFSRNVNIINWKNFPTHGGIKNVRENSTSILKRDKAVRSLKKYERMYPWG